MATILAPSDLNESAFIKSQLEVQTTEIQPESPDQGEESGPSEDEARITNSHKMRLTPSSRPQLEAPVKIPVIPDHPTFLPNGTTIQNVETHMLCNDWFLKNVRELVEEYKRLQVENRSQAGRIVALNREVANLKYQVRNITEERDEYKADYESEVTQHQKTQIILQVVRGELAKLRILYNNIIGQLKDAKARLAEALREVARLKVDVADKDARIKDLEEKLRISNASEDAANARVTELQRVIYELERARTRLETQKDIAEHDSRTAADTVKRLRDRIANLEKEIRRLKKKLERRVGMDDIDAMEASSEFETMSQEPVLKEQGALPAAEDALVEELAEEASSPADEE